MTFYFYDLETSGGSPRSARIMQFAGQRVNEKLEPIGVPDDILVKLSDDVIPEPDAVLVHGITPQKALAEGVTEAEFAALFHEKIATPDTVFVGFNNIRFDDEFMRRMCYRTFYDPYQWHWKDGRSRWDILDPIRMMRALRPDGLKWPMLKGKPSVKLELLAKENGLTHENAHDALSDVVALIELAQKFKTAQPKLFAYLLDTRDKKAVAKLVEAGQPFVYTSGRYSSEYDKTTVVDMLIRHPRRDAAVVYNLREDPAPWLDKTPEELAHHWRPPFGDKETPRLPVKTLQHNRCPAVAPMSVLDDETAKRIKIDAKALETHRATIAKNEQFIQNIEKALDILERQQQTSLLPNDSVDTQIYDGFWTQRDQNELLQVRMAEPEQFTKLQETVRNKRIREMMPLYKARNFGHMLSIEERESWDAYREAALTSGGKKSPMNTFAKRMQELGSRQLSSHDEYLLTELQLYVESIT